MIEPPLIDLQDLRAVSLLGRGAKGVVFLVRPTSDALHLPPLLALKVFSRSSPRSKPHHDHPLRRILFERDALLAFNHPLLPSLHGFVSTESLIGFLIDHCPGGDLNSLRRRQTEKMFSEDVIRFYAAELVLVLDHLHSLGFVYRDLKPENVLIQHNGHIMLVDFDLSTKLLPSPQSPLLLSPPKIPRRRPLSRLRRWLSCTANITPDLSDSSPEETAPRAPRSPSPSSPSTDRSNSFVGTEDYVAPEIVRGSGHDFAVDWWGLGVVLYEMLYGRTPFRGQNRKDTFCRILELDPELTGDPNPLRDLIGRLLEKEPKRRIGVEGVKRHEFFRGVDWDRVIHIGRPPYIPADEKLREGEEDIDVERMVQEFALAKEKKNDSQIL